MKRQLRVLLRRILPVLSRKAEFRYEMWSNYRYDAQRFSAFGGARTQQGQVTLEALITMDYHRLEKGLSLRNPNPEFGVQVARELITNAARYCARYGPSPTIEVCINVLDEYVRFKRKNSQPIDNLACSIEELKKRYLQESAIRNGGTLEIERASVKSMVEAGGKQFFKSRHSLRDFSSKPVETESIKAAVEIAATTPSVCNRQAWHVHAVFDGEMKDRILDVQNGNRGFRSQIQCVLIVTADLRRFVTIGERNQAWIDGGMFSMSLIYALHSLGLGSCCLNWSAPKWRDLELRNRFPLKPYEVVIMMIAVGHMPEKFRVACSQRKSTDEFLSVH